MDRAHPVQLEGGGDSAPATPHLIDDAMPIMLTYVDADQRYRYHNRAFRDWLGLQAHEINGHSVRDVLGPAMYARIQTRIGEALSGRAVRYERSQKRRDGGTERVFVNLVPRVERGNVIGLYATVVTLKRSEHGVGFQPEVTTLATKDNAAESGSLLQIGQAQELYDAAIDSEFAGREHAADQIRAAIRDDKFALFVQPVRDLQSDSQGCFEVFLRMTAEEEAMLPPGAFFLLAEKHDLMGQLDQWTVTNVLKAIVAHRTYAPQSQRGWFCIGLSRTTLLDPHFPDFVRAKLTAYEVPGEALRFQIQQTDALASPEDALHLVRELARLDCWSILAGFGRDKVSFDSLKDLAIGFLKIDSSIILRLERGDESARTMVRSVTRVAHTVGINIIAEFVETPEVICQLRDMGVDYAQGLAIGSPLPISTALSGDQ